MISMAESEFVEHIGGSSTGYCINCDDTVEHGCVEPDAEDYPCPECNENTVMGIEQALLLGYINVTEG